MYDKYEHENERERGRSDVAPHINFLGDGGDLRCLRLSFWYTQARRPYGQNIISSCERSEHIRSFDDVFRGSERRDILHFSAGFECARQKCEDREEAGSYVPCILIFWESR
jgi:hypothetical protein